MTWTILILVVSIALYVFGGILLNRGTKKPTTGAMLLNKVISIVAIILVAGSVCRLYTPYYLTSVNPMILQEMVKNAQQQQQEEMARQQEEASKQVRSFVVSHAKELMEKAPVLGNPEASNTIYVWTDFSCPFCRRVHGDLDRVLKERKDVRVVIKNFSIHGDLSDAPAKAVIAAKLQSPEKSATLVDALMTHDFFSKEDMKDRSKLGKKVEANVLKFAEDAGLNVAKLKEDMNSEFVQSELMSVHDLAQQFKIGGTPFVVINGQVFPGAIPYGQIIEALEK